MVWLIPIAVGGVVALGTVVKLTWDYFRGKEVLFLLHGEQEVGKSTIISSLSGKEYEPHTAQHEKVDISSASKNMESDFKAIAMIDVGGSDIFKRENEDVRNEFWKSDAIKAFLYVFNAKNFDNEEKYRYGLETYKKICKDHNVLFCGIGTHADKFSTKQQREELEKRIRKDFGIKTYIINACSRDEVAKVYVDILKTLQEKYQ